MVWTRTLAQLVTDVTTRCDVDGYVARHPLASVRRLVIESYHRLREFMTTSGSHRWMSGPYLLATNDHGSPDYATIMPLSTTTVAGALVPLESPMSVEAKIDGKWKDLTAIGLGDAHDWYPQNTATNGQPEAWVLLGTGYDIDGSTLQGSDPTFSETIRGGQFNIMVLPKFDVASYPIQVYAEQAIDVTDADAATLTLDGPGFEWIIWDVAIKIAARDNDSQGTFAIANQERAKVEGSILLSIRRENKASTQRRDVFRGGRMGAFRRGRSAL